MQGKTTQKSICIAIVTNTKSYQRYLHDVLHYVEKIRPKYKRALHDHLS